MSKTTTIIFDRNARLGVLTFFVISGYLITHLLLKEWNTYGGIDLKAFYIRRVFRIFPAFYAYLLVIVALHLFGLVATSFPLIVSAATFSLNYADLWIHLDHRYGDYWFVGHFWTLSLEEQFYVLWPSVLLALGVGRLKRLIGFVLLMCPFVRVASYLFLPATRIPIYIMSHAVADPIVAGCALALWENEGWFEKLTTRLSSGTLPLLAFVGAFFVSPLLAMHFGKRYELPIGIFFTSVCLAVVVLWATRFPDNAIGRLLNGKVFTTVGVLSYSLYLWQQLFLTPLNGTVTGKFPLNIFFCFPVALASYHFIEKPFLRLRTRLFSSKGRREEVVRGI